MLWRFMEIERYMEIQRDAVEIQWRYMAIHRDVLRYVDVCRDAWRCRREPDDIHRH